MSCSFHAADTTEQAARLKTLAQVALEHWDGRFDDLVLVKHRENAVFSARDEEGRRVALRIHRHGYHSDEALTSELAWMVALEGAGLRTPQVVPTRTNKLLAHAGTPDIPGVRQVDLLTWLDGWPLADQVERCDFDAATAATLYRCVGATAARLHNQADAWSRPALFIRHQWDRPALLGEAPLWGRFWEYPGLSGSDRRMIERTRARLQSDLAAYAAEGDYGLIHADMIPDNLLWDGARLGLIDFDDAGFGWRMFELATILHFLADNPHAAVMEEAVVEGYRSVRPLAARDLETLPMFLALRGLTYVGWVHTRGETQTAQDLAPALIDLCRRRAEDYLEGK